MANALATVATVEGEAAFRVSDFRCMFARGKGADCLTEIRLTEGNTIYSTYPLSAVRARITKGFEIMEAEELEEKQGG